MNLPAQSARGSSDRFQGLLALSNAKAPRFSYTRTSDCYLKIIVNNLGVTDATNTF